MATRINRHKSADLIGGKGDHIVHTVYCRGESARIPSAGNDSAGKGLGYYCLLVQCFYYGLLGQVVERHVDVGGREHVAVVEDVGLDRVWTEVGARVFRVGFGRTLLVNRLAVGHRDAVIYRARNAILVRANVGNDLLFE